MSKKLTPREQKIALFVAKNRGVCSRIAREVRPPVSTQFVHMVLAGDRRSGDGRVESELRKAGAPV